MKTKNIKRHEKKTIKNLPDMIFSLFFISEILIILSIDANAFAISTESFNPCNDYNDLNELFNIRIYNFSSIEFEKNEFNFIKSSLKLKKASEILKEDKNCSKISLNINFEQLRSTEFYNEKAIIKNNELKNKIVVSDYKIVSYNKKSGILFRFKKCPDYIAKIESQVIYDNVTKFYIVCKDECAIRIKNKKNAKNEKILWFKDKFIILQFFKSANVCINFYLKNKSIKKRCYEIQTIEKNTTLQIDYNLKKSEDVLQTTLDLLIKIKAKNFIGKVNVSVECLSKDIICEKQKKEIFLKNETKTILFKIIPKIKASNIKIQSYNLVDLILNYEIKDMLAKTSFEPLILKITIKAKDQKIEKIITKNLISIYFQPTKLYDYVTLIIIVIAISYYVWIFYFSDIIKKIKLNKNKINTTNTNQK